jgi:hypothetical protein
MPFIRPELQHQFWRWREALLGGALFLVGGYWGLAGHGVAAAAGMSFAIVGALLIFAGIQRTRFRRGAGGPGLVEVDERRVVYFGPHDGGVVSIDGLRKVELDPAAHPSGAWVLTEPGAQPLRIPTDAENAEALFDVFAALDGIETERMLRHLEARPGRRVTVWETEQNRLH